MRDKFPNLTADRSTLDNFTADHPGSAVKLSSEGGGGGGGCWVCGSFNLGDVLVKKYLAVNCIDP